MKIIGFAAFALAALATSAWAQEPQPDCENPVTQMDMNICAGEDFSKADEALNAVYRKVMAAMRDTDAELKEMSPDLVGAADALKKAQRAWIDYRDGHCELAGFEARGGSMEPMLISGCMAELTQARTKELQALLGDDSE
ncbi:MAG TPA: lysozyme inhibitor LprI family protein [Mesorhizobium sp.]|jgi:uncharacterized protein YecT (DUF1311 family)|nr:lysozyme inhibitor LprI family protein [Mesorhizobium sp.]